MAEDVTNGLDSGKSGLSGVIAALRNFIANRELASKHPFISSLHPSLCVKLICCFPHHMDCYSLSESSHFYAEYFADYSKIKWADQFRMGFCLYPCKEKICHSHMCGLVKILRCLALTRTTKICWRLHIPTLMVAIFLTSF